MKVTIEQGFFNPATDFTLTNFPLVTNILAEQSRSSMPLLKIQFEEGERAYKTMALSGLIIKMLKKQDHYGNPVFLNNLKKLAESDLIITFNLVEYIGSKDGKACYAPISLAYLYSINTLLNEILLHFYSHQSEDLAPKRECFNTRHDILAEFITHLQYYRLHYENSGMFFGDYDQELEILLPPQELPLIKQQSEVSSFIQKVKQPSVKGSFFQWLPQEILQTTLGFYFTKPRFSPTYIDADDNILISPDFSLTHFLNYDGAYCSQIMHHILSIITGGYEYEGRYIENLIANDNSGMSRFVIHGLEKAAKAGALTFANIRYENPIWLAMPRTLELTPCHEFFVIKDCDLKKLKRLCSPASGVWLDNLEELEKHISNLSEREERMQRPSLG